MVGAVLARMRRYGVAGRSAVRPEDVSLAASVGSPAKPPVYPRLPYLASPERLREAVVGILDEQYAAAGAGDLDRQLALTLPPPLLAILQSALSTPARLTPPVVRPPPA